MNTKFTALAGALLLLSGMADGMRVPSNSALNAAVYQRYMEVKRNSGPYPSLFTPEQIEQLLHPEVDETLLPPHLLSAKDFYAGLNTNFTTLTADKLTDAENNKLGEIIGYINQAWPGTNQGSIVKAWCRALSEQNRDLNCATTVFGNMLQVAGHHSFGWNVERYFGADDFSGLSLNDCMKHFSYKYGFIMTDKRKEDLMNSIVAPREQ